MPSLYMEHGSRPGAPVAWNSIHAALMALSYGAFGLFFFDALVDHPHLHSFPTRRSSDLPRRTATAAPVPGPTRPARCRTAPARSEEHTSELQSRRDIVCRLLLEKK